MSFFCDCLRLLGYNKMGWNEMWNKFACFIVLWYLSRGMEIIRLTLCHTRGEDKHTGIGWNSMKCVQPGLFWFYLRLA